MPSRSISAASRATVVAALALLCRTIEAGTVYAPGHDYYLVVQDVDPSTTAATGEAFGGSVIGSNIRAVHWGTGFGTQEFQKLGAGDDGWSSTTILDHVGSISVGTASAFDDNRDYIGMRAARWDANGAITELGMLPGDPRALTYSADAVNNGGTAVGQGGNRAIRWDANSTVAVDLGPGAARFINDAGTVAGRGPGGGAARWAPLATTPSLLQAPAGATNIHVTGLNAAGSVVGWYEGAQYRTHALRWDPSSEAYLPLPGVPNSSTRANDINDAGTVVGSTGADAARWDPAGTLTQLGTVPGGAGGYEAIDSNNAGVAVGWMVGGQKAMLWKQDGTAVDLTDHFSYVDPLDNVTWHLVKALSISQTGWVGGYMKSDLSVANDLARFFLVDTFFLTGTPGDANRDASVDFEDLLIVAQHYNTGGTWDTGDFTQDGAVNFDDLLALAQHYEGPPPTALGSDFDAHWALALSAVPEPASAACAALAVCCISRRRRPAWRR